MDGERDKSLVWLEDGREESFEPAAPMRPWLEESAAWGQPDAPDQGTDVGDKGDDAPTLVWL